MREARTASKFEERMRNADIPSLQDYAEVQLMLAGKALADFRQHRGTDAAAEAHLETERLLVIVTALYNRVEDM